MSEVQSYIFDFQRTPKFFHQWNIDFKVSEMESSSNNFEVVYCSYAPSNIIDCLNANGSLNNNVTVLQSVDLSLKYDNGVITVRNDSTWNMGNTINQIKAVFVRHKSSGFVMGYSININAFEVTNIVKLEKDTILWSILDYHGESI